MEDLKKSINEVFSDSRLVMTTAICKWGEENQINAAIEEMAELIVELRHKCRGRENHSEEEFADVVIMLSQIMHLMDKDEITRQIEAKMDRLERRISQ